MKFGARYEILRALTRGDVETFEIRDRATGEKALAHIFECAEPPLDQPTVQWILTSFGRLAPESPGEAIDVGRYDVASFAYIVTRWPADEAVDGWVSEYHSKIGATPVIPSSDSPAGHGTGKQSSPAVGFPSGQAAAVVDSSPAEFGSGLGPAAPPSEFTRQFFGGMAFVGEPGSGKEQAKTTDEPGGLGVKAIAPEKDGPGLAPPESTSGVSSPPVSEVPVQASHGPGAFTQQFFREINISPDGTPGASTNISASIEHHEVDSASPPTGAFTQQFFREINISPDGTPGPSTNISALPEHRERDGESPRQPGSTPAPWDEPPLSSETGFDIQGKAAVPDSQSGQFTKLFRQGPGSAMSPSQPDESPSEEPTKSGSGEFTRLFRMPAATADNSPAIDRSFTPESRGSSGEFTRIFGSSVPDALEGTRSQSVSGEPEVASPRGSSTEILSGGPVSDRQSGEDSYTTGASGSFEKADDGGATQVFAQRPEYPKDYERTPSPAPVTGPIASAEQGIPDFSRFEAAGDGSATVVFRPTAEAAAEVHGGLPKGPSEYTMFMNRDDVLAAAAGSPDAPAVPEASRAGAPGAAFASPLVAAPVIPSYQPPAPPVPAYPPVPAVPGIAVPAAPSIAPPAIPAPALAAPGGQPAPAPKSYWPLIIILNVLFVLAVLLILYFVLKH